jgi:hypothetical protein
VKELRYVLDLACDVDPGLRKALGETKDAIGEWHDWCELEDAARRALKCDSDLCERIHAQAREKFDRALAVARDLQNTYLRADASHAKRPHKPLRLKEPVLISAARMSA